LNDVSLVLQVDFGNSTLILPGDIDQSVEALLFRGRKPPEHLLLVSPHHGSELSNPAFLFDYLRPQAVVFSCGYDNLFGFPSSAALAECTKRGIPIFRTDLHGAIEAISDGLKWNVRPANHQTNQ
jgi:competence protein ComEC